MRLLVVEDDALLADGLLAALRQSGYQVDACATGSAADAALSNTGYDLAILDLGLPELDGFQVLRRLRMRRQQLPVLILTAREDVQDRVHGLDLGADDYLTKPFALPEIEARIRALLRRSQGSGTPIVHVGRLALDSVGHRIALDGSAIELSGREYAVLETLMSRAGRVVSKDQFLTRLTDFSSDLGENAIEVYMHRVRRKIEGAGVRIRTIRGLGYLLEPDQAAN